MGPRLRLLTFQKKLIMNLGTEHFVTLIFQLSENRLSTELMQSWLNTAIEAIEDDYLALQPY